MLAYQLSAFETAK